MIIKYNINVFKYIFFIFVSTTFSLPANSDLSSEELIKGRKAIFSKNYSTAKKVQVFASKGNFEKAKSLMIEMSENYKSLLEYFPENTQDGFRTEALPAIWKNKEQFSDLMTKSSNNMIKLAAIIESSENVKSSLQKLMWNNCKACHSKFRAAH